jgi:hypothetical protein
MVGIFILSNHAADRGTCSAALGYVIISGKTDPSLDYREWG